MTKRPTPAEASNAYLALLRHRIDDECAAALEIADRYKRPALSSAFRAGWFAWRHRSTLASGLTSPVLSKLARGAFMRGLAAREQYETTHHTLEDE